MPGAFAAHFDPLADHLRFYTPRTLRALLEDFGFEQLAVRAAGRGGAAALARAAVRARF